MSAREADVVVIGSGASAVAAAVPLVGAGLRVLMLDVGDEAPVLASKVPVGPWKQLRRSDANQHEYFLGPRGEGIPPAGSGVGLQLTPPRAYVAERAPELLPRESKGFVGLESVALGGLASAWGGAIAPWNERDLRGLPVTLAELQSHYDAVAGLMGVCGRADDDLREHLPPLAGMMPPLTPDTASARVLAAYERRRADMRAKGLTLGAARLAVCSQPYQGRGPMSDHDMDFWVDHSRAVYRPVWTLDTLRAKPNFELVQRTLVLRVVPEGGGVRVEARALDGGEMTTFQARRVVLAAGALGSARIAIRSLNRFGTHVNLVTNHSPYFPVLNLGMIGQTPDDARHSLTQLTGFYSPKGGPEVQLQFYSYRSLLAFKLMKDAPLPARQCRRLLQSCGAALSVLGVHYDDQPDPGLKRAWLENDDGDGRLRVEYDQPAAQSESQRRIASSLRGVMASLRCIMLWPRNLGYGASIHYAGTLPMTPTPGPLQTGPDGAAGGLPGVYVADSSVFPSLPAKGVTFTMMANAHRVGAGVAKELA